jgi:hypothetical protein
MSAHQTGESFDVRSLKKKALFETKAPSLQSQSFSNPEGQEGIVQGEGPEKRDRLKEHSHLSRAIGRPSRLITKKRWVEIR